MISKSDENLIIDVADKIIDILPEFSDVFTLDIQSNLLEQAKDIEDESKINSKYSKAYDLILSQGYISPLKSSSIPKTILTDLGREVKRSGGHNQYLQKLDLEKNREETRRELEAKNIETSIKLNEYLLKTKWLPHLLSLIALVVSVIAILKN